jgi:hypothetical protein
VTFRRVNAYLAESACGWYVIVKPSAKAAGPYTAYVGLHKLGQFEHVEDAQRRCAQWERNRA